MISLRVVRGQCTEEVILYVPAASSARPQVDLASSGQPGSYRELDLNCFYSACAVCRRAFTQHYAEF